MTTDAAATAWLGSASAEFVCIAAPSHPFIAVGTFQPDVSTNHLPLQRTCVLLKPHILWEWNCNIPPPCRFQHTCGLEYSTDMVAIAQDQPTEEVKPQNGPSSTAVKNAPGASWKNDETHVLPHNRLSVVRRQICVLQ